MKKRLLIILLVIAVIAGLEALAIFSKPKIVFKTNGAGDSSQAVETVVNRELSLSFKTETSEQVPASQKEVFLLNLELIGTAMGNAKDPSAFIKDLDSGKQGIYKLGSVIQQAKVIKIAMGRVTLDVKGKEQILTMYAKGKSYGSLNSSGQNIISVLGDQFLVNKNNLVSESGKIIKELTHVKVSPYFESMKVAGLKVEGITPDSIVAAAGIHNQDVVTMVNSQKIDSYQKALQVLNKAKGQTEIKVSVLRDGQPQLLCYKFQ